MSVIARPRSQVLILSGTIALVLAAGICNGLAAMARVDPSKFRPDGLWQVSLLGLLVTTAASVAAVVGKRLLNRPTAALLGAVGGGLTASLVNPLLGALGGFAVGLLVSLDLGQRAVHVAIASFIGVVGAGLARRIYLEAGSDWLWASILMLLVTLGLQLMLCLFRVRKYATQRTRRPRRTVVSVVALTLVVLVTLVGSWIGGWHGEMLLRMRGIEERGGGIYLQWASRSPWDWLWGPFGASVALNNPTARDWITVRTLPSVSWLTISGEQTDDEALDGMPALPGVRFLFINDSNVTGRFLGDRKLPNLGGIIVSGSPFDDEALNYVGRLRGLTTLSLNKTNVTGIGLARLGKLPLTTLTISGNQLRDDDLQGLVDMPLTTLYIDCPNITGDGFQYLTNLGRLTNLRIGSPVDHLAVRHLRGMDSLVDLTVHLEEITPATMDELRQIRKAAKLTVFVPQQYASKLPSLDQQLPNAQIYTYNADR